jgi:hypothetical protein
MMLIAGSGRYATLDTAEIKMPDGRMVTYLRRRFVPNPANFATLQEIFVAEGDRLDLLTAQYLGDPEQFWRVCDANGAMNPEDLTATIGRKLRITLPEGIPATPNA